MKPNTGVASMLMTDEEIREAIAKGELNITPFSEDCLQGASYDIRIGKQILVSNRERVIDPEIDGPARLEPGEFALLTTLERITLKPNVAGHLGAKTYFTRKGLILLSGLQVDPGWDAVLALAVYNSSPKSIVLEFGEKICTVQFFKLPQPVAKTIDMSRFTELQRGELPRVEKDFFRDLEARSLTEIEQELRQLVQNVSTLSDSVDRIKDELRRGFEELRRGVYSVLVVVGFGWAGLIGGLLATR